MTGWIIYNGTLNIPKIIELVDSLVEDARKLGINLEAIKNTELIPMYDNNGEAKLIYSRKVEEPKFIIFWDKDVLLASHLEKMGYRVFNSSTAIKNCDHKGLMHLVLSNNSISMPKTIISPMIFDYLLNSEDYLINCYEALGESVIIKEAMGSFGMQVYLINNREEFINKVKDLNKNKIDFIIQENIKSSFGKDIRVNIIGDKVIGAMLRTSERDFRANISQGGKGTLVELNKEQEEIALKAHKVLGLDFSGVDLLFGENNKPLLCEVNSNLNFLSFEKIYGKGFGKKILEYILGEIL
ncbi:MAG: RimK family alpha-L-glutamate ligase [Clostridium sp.]|jgi:alpha-L-glutamate ligase, RimK family|uniref:ATP-grasp domain-containing protein n=1 Tax=Clostridium sp. TaxID=1506 RepID=UPI0025DA7C3A|nr:RimK family alpha-L-glutamate ligase [Clostridium sp.]MCI6691615.1 RimK family alpha-L-glutamate ligase [Clostridium sp.]MDY2631147.1 RimK family alpha-L-glutamate ligase [Clostridium sp.]MDY4251873.1 RimK family alpha-L-glutamate ligase [Clostridium sp.]